MILQVLWRRAGVIQFVCSANLEILGIFFRTRYILLRYLLAAIINIYHLLLLMTVFCSLPNLIIAVKCKRIGGSRSHSLTILYYLSLRSLP